MHEIQVGTPFTFVVTYPGSGPTTPADLALFKDGAVASVVATSSQIGTSNAWAISFTPSSTGLYSVFAFGSIQYRVPCVSKLSYEMLKNIEDEALGSWQWNKTSGVLSVFRQDGTLLATHSVTDTLTAASRERTA